MLCFSDAVAATMVRVAQDAGLRVPDDLSVVGFDDSPLASRMRPALTTVRQDVLLKGRAAVAALRAEMAGTSSGEQVLLPTELVVRESTTTPA